jgi:hypothetical protein
LLNELPTGSSLWGASHAERNQDVISNHSFLREYICFLEAFLLYMHVSIQGVGFVVTHLGRGNYWAASSRNLAQDATVGRAYLSYIHTEIVECRIYESSAQDQARIFSGTKREAHSRISANHFMNYISFWKNHILK